VKRDPTLSQERPLGECYRLLAACFYPPQKTLWLEENLLGNMASALKGICPSAEEPIRRMQEACSDCSAEDLMVEYARLFVGPQRVIASPYGSVYLEEGRRVMGDSTLDALQTYQEAGLHLDPDFKELPDHIAVELEFSYYLTAKALEADASHRGDEAAHQRAARDAFLDRHLRRWVPPFCAAIDAGTAHPFYRALAECLKAAIANPSPRAIVGTP
jgi:putative dimethyl sulfoxide reductase chaperone